MTAPVLAGFSLATIALLLTTEASKRPPLADWSVAAFAITAALTIYVIQFSAVAAGYSSPPGERLDWFPEATVDARGLTFARELQATDLVLANKYVWRSDLCYEAGLIAFLVGLTLLVTPAQWTLLRVVPVAVGCGAVAVELVWIAARRLPTDHWLRRKLLPGRGNVKSQPLSELTPAEIGVMLSDEAEPPLERRRPQEEEADGPAESVHAR